MIGENSLCVHGGKKRECFVYSVKLMKQSLESVENIVPKINKAQLRKNKEECRDTGGVNRVESS